MSTQNSEYQTSDSMSLIDNMQIKEEETNELILDIKPEKEDIISDDNPFENVQVEVKEEFITPNCEDDKENMSVPVDEAENFIETEINDTNLDDSVKMEMPYEYPSVDDGSMDSEEATALNNVEACLQDEINIKHEIYEVICA